MNKIGTAREYFDGVVAYNLQQYKAQPTNLPAAFNLANSLFHMYEWLWNGHETQIKNHYSQNFANNADFNSFVQSSCQSFKHIRDLANASKHMSLNNRASTSAKHITDTEAVSSVWDVDGNWDDNGTWDDRGKWGRGVVVINDGGQNIDFENCADDVHKFWQDLLKQLGI